MQKTEELIARTFTTDITEGLVDAISQAYESNSSIYSPSIGHDNMTFGLMVYKSKVFFISELAASNSSVRILTRTPFFSFQVGDYILSTYRAGDSLDLNIDDAFPKNKSRAATLALRNQAQLTLPFVDDSNCRDLILADIGNPIDGLGTVFLGVPSEVSADNRITRWSSTYEIWRSDIPTPSTLLSREPDKPAVEETAPPVLSLKEIDKVRSGE